MILAYHTGAFARASKVKPLRHYLSQLRNQGDSAAGLLGAFQAMQSRGMPVSIKRLN